jgi:hypothetical protein
MDEAGFQIGDSSRFKRVIIPQTGRMDFTVPSNATRLVSVVEAINTEGRSALPLFITEGKVFPESILPTTETMLQMRLALHRNETSAFANRLSGIAWLKECFCWP